MRKPLALVSVVALSLGLLTACSSAPDKKADSGQKETASGKGGGDAKPADTAATGAGADKNTGTTTPSEPGSEPGPVASRRAPLPQVEAAQKKINVEELPNTMTIVTVAGTPISVGEYRRMFKLQQLQLQNAVSVNPMARARIVAEAQKRGVTLTPDEKSKLLAVARGGKPADSPEFKDLLKSKGVSEAQFSKEVFEVGTAIKTVNVMLQQSLLNDLVNREILCSAAEKSNLKTKAMNRYFDIKNSPSYKQLITVTGFAPEQLKDELYKSELTKLMIEKIQSRAQVTDKDIADYYNANKDAFKHGERVRLSQIIVAAPSQDMGPIQSVRTQLKKANPKLAGKELDAAVTLTMDALKRKAQEILIKAKNGDNFAELANTFTDDIPAKVGKTGGDIGYREKTQLPPELSKVIFPLKEGDVYPGLVQSDLGFQIFKVTAHDEPGPVALGEVKEIVRGGLKQQKMDVTLANWLRDKRRTVPVVLDPQFASLIAAEQAKGSQTSSLTMPH